MLKSSEIKKSSFLGKWQATANCLIYNPKGGTKNGGIDLTLDIYKQDGAFLFARKQWQLKKDHKGIGDIGDKEVRNAAEDIIGMLKFDETKALFIETIDNGLMEIELIDENTLHYYYTENSHNEATLYRAELKRVNKDYK